jgi:ribosomal protein S18 acetylase RimI-like enzyme
MRAATLADLADLVELETAGFDGDYAAHRWTAQQFRYYLRHPRALTAIARRDGRAIGYVSGLLSSGSRAGQARLHSIVVVHRLRRGGVGRSLLDWFLDQAAAAGATLVLLEVSVARRDALRLFEQAGFGRPERLAGYYGPGSDGLRLRKSLGESRWRP